MTHSLSAAGGHGPLVYSASMRLSAFIISNMEAVLQEWEDFARSLGTVTSSMDAEALRDHAELMLRAVAVDLETAQSPAQQEAKSEGDAPERAAHLPESAATSHGLDRAEEGFTLEQMVSEYRALRATVPRLWAKVQRLPDPEAFQELMRFNEAIDEALADSIKTYSYAVDQMAASRARVRMEALGTLSAGLGHDMTNVLLPMRMCLSTIADQPLNPETVPLVEALRSAVEHLGGLSNGLRALAMDPEGSASAAHSTVLHEWWASAISPFTWALPGGVRLHAEGLRADRGLPPVNIPAHALMQAVFNLVQNAAQSIGQRNAANPSMPATGNIWITAEPWHSVDGLDRSGVEGAVVLTVRDDGPGMDAATLARCTDRFFTTRAKDHGTGLGLFLVRSVLEQYGGKLMIESKVGQGSSFMLILPVAAAKIDPAHDAGTSSQSRS